jgi:hypothetical protein
MTERSSRGGTASADADDRSSSGKSTTTTSSRGIPRMTVHLQIALVCSADAIARKLDLISKLLAREGASDVSIAVSVSEKAFRPTNAARTNGGWDRTVPLGRRGADDI